MMIFWDSDECSAVLLLEACDLSSLCILLQSDANPQEKQRLVLYHQEVQQLKEELGLSIDVNTAPEKSIKVSILKSEKRSRPPTIN